jgi:hypothetical protein
MMDRCVIGVRSVQRGDDVRNRFNEIANSTNMTKAESPDLQVARSSPHRLSRT